MKNLGGRPRLMKDCQKLTLWIDADLALRIRSLSERTGISMNQIATNLLSASIGPAESIEAVGGYGVRRWFDQVKEQVAEEAKPAIV